MPAPFMPRMLVVLAAFGCVLLSEEITGIVEARKYGLDSAKAEPVERLNGVISDWASQGTAGPNQTALGAPLPLAFVRSMGAHIVRSSSSAGTASTSPALKPVPRTPPLPQPAGNEPEVETISITEQVASMDPEAMARHRWEVVREERNRKSCVWERARRTALASEAAEPCSKTRFITVKDSIDEAGSFGMMLIKMEKLLSLSCLTQRTLMIPQHVYGHLTGLADLNRLRQAGFCFIPDQKKWQDKALKAYQGGRVTGLNGGPSKAAKFFDAATEPGFQSGTPLSKLADILNREDYQAQPGLHLKSAAVMATCGSMHDEKHFFGSLAPPSSVKEEVQYFQHFWMHPLTKLKVLVPGALSWDEFHRLARKQSLGEIGSGHFTAVSLAQNKVECLRSAASKFHTYNGAAIRVAATCWPTLDMIQGVKSISETPSHAVFVAGLHKNEWREGFNEQVNASEQQGGTWRRAVSYEPTNGEQWARRGSEQKSAKLKFQTCKSQQTHDPSTVAAGACEKLLKDYSTKADHPSLNLLAPYVNFWLMAGADCCQQTHRLSTRGSTGAPLLSCVSTVHSRLPAIPLHVIYSQNHLTRDVHTSHVSHARVRFSKPSMATSCLSLGTLLSFWVSCPMLCRQSLTSLLSKCGPS